MLIGFQWRCYVMLRPTGCTGGTCFSRILFFLCFKHDGDNACDKGFILHAHYITLAVLITNTGLSSVDRTLSFLYTLLSPSEVCMVLLSDTDLL